jgi:hypothetical protein
MDADRDLIITSAEEHSSADIFPELRRSGFTIGFNGPATSPARPEARGGHQRHPARQHDQQRQCRFGGWGDLGVPGSTVVADGRLKLKADRDIGIVSTQNRSEQSSESCRSQSGLFGKIGRPTLSTMTFDQDGQGSNVEQVGSMVGSLGGNASIEAKGRCTQTASSVTAADGFAACTGGADAGNMTIQAGEVLIDAGNLVCLDQLLDRVESRDHPRSCNGVDDHHGAGAGTGAVHNGPGSGRQHAGVSRSVANRALEPNRAGEK